VAFTKKPALRLAVFFLSSFLLAACGGTIPTPNTLATSYMPVVGATQPVGQTAVVTQPAATPVSGELTVFAAASLTDTFNEMKIELEKANPNLKITYNFAASNALRTQLEQGAKADVFASADQMQMDNAAKSGLVEGQSTIFVRNHLAVIVPKNNPAKIEKLQDLAKSGVKFVTAQKEVPVGAYTVNALQKMSKEGAFGADFQTKVEANIVSREANVRQVVSKVELGEADAAIAYISDVTPKVAPAVITIDIPERFNTIANYPIAPLKSAANPTAAKAFIAYILSPAGQAILKKNNFVPIS
jgi:molybdate transport system substrate-binding protein